MLRRPSGSSSFAAVAAEVLEARSLLSAGVVSAAQAIHHADFAFSHGSLSPAATLTNYAVTTQLTIAAIPDVLDFPAVVSIGPVLQKVGAHVRAQFSANFVSGPEHVVIAGNITGKVQSWVPQGINTAFTLVPGGSLHVHVTGGPGGNSSFSIRPAGTPLTIDIDNNGLFVSFQSDFKSSNDHSGTPFNLLAFTN
jgi:hypothetical protein